MDMNRSGRLCWVGFLSAGLLIGSNAAIPAVVAAPQPVSGMGQRAMPMQHSDQHFMVMMIPHHDGVIAMAELALTRAQRPEIKALAERIKSSQTSENAQMRRWYRQWYGTDIPTGTSGGMGMRMGMGSGMGHGMGMPGMATCIEALKTANDFDRAFIEQMMPHLRMGVMMASHAQLTTKHRELRELEAAMVRVQSQDIEQMERWYLDWYGTAGR